MSEEPLDKEALLSAVTYVAASRSFIREKEVSEADVEATILEVCPGATVVFTEDYSHAGWIALIDPKAPEEKEDHTWAPSDQEATEAKQKALEDHLDAHFS